MALISVAEALDHVLAHAAALAADEVPLDEAAGRVLALDLKARRTQPPADVSAMDGYAVRSADVAAAPARLKVIGEVAAGRPFNAAVGAGEAARIFTGGFVPAGADTVVVQEVTKTRRRLGRGAKGDHQGPQRPPSGARFPRRRNAVRQRPSAYRARSRARRRHEPSALAGASASRKSRCLRPATNWCRPARSRDRARSSIRTALRLPRSTRAEGADFIDLGVVPDNLEETIDAVRRARDLDADILVTTGGASVGDHDLVQTGVRRRRHGAVVLEGGDAARPAADARPARRHAGAWLPGNPVSSYVCAFLFLVPLIRKLAGREDLTFPSEPALLGCDLPENDERADYLRALLDGRSRRPRGDAVPDPGQLDDGAAGEIRLPGDPRNRTRRRRKPAAACEIVRLDR